jgi:sialidase-1
VLDESTGTLWLLLTHNLGTDRERDIAAHVSKGTRTVWVCSSTDNGATWTPPQDITSTAKNPAWTWYATGPGVGIQIQSGPHAGRLVIPCDHNYDDPADPAKHISGSHAIFSDDHGKTWQLGGVIHPRVNECQVVELFDGSGTLLMNMRSGFGHSCRAQSTSNDGGITWSPPVDAPALVEPVCQASILRFQGAGTKAILFSNPADPKARRHLTVRMSEDDARTWPRALELHAGPSAYSCVVALEGGQAGCLFECGEKNAYERIAFARFALDELAAVEAKP